MLDCLWIRLCWLRLRYWYLLENVKIRNTNVCCRAHASSTLHSYIHLTKILGNLVYLLLHLRNLASLWSKRLSCLGLILRWSEILLMLGSLVGLDWLATTEEVIRCCRWMRLHRLLLLLWHVTSGVCVGDVVLDLSLSLIWVLGSEGDLLDVPLFYGLLVLPYIHESTNLLRWLTLLTYFDFLLLLLLLELASYLAECIANI